MTRLLQLLILFVTAVGLGQGFGTFTTDQPFLAGTPALPVTPETVAGLTMYLNADDLTSYGAGTVTHWPDRVQTPIGGIFVAGLPWYGCYGGTNSTTYGMWGDENSPYVGFFRGTNENCGGLATSAASTVNSSWSVFVVFRPDNYIISQASCYLLEGGTSGSLLSTGTGRIEANFPGTLPGGHSIVTPLLSSNLTYTFVMTQNTNTLKFASYVNGVQYTNIPIAYTHASDSIFQPGEFRFYNVAFRWSGYIKIAALYSNEITADRIPGLHNWVMTNYPSMFP
jgi:hypothetical protein